MTVAAISRQAGLTLIEVLIAVALFSLIGLAGFTLVQSIIGVQQRTERRLDDLADLQRTMHILTSDFEQATPGSLSYDGVSVTLRRESESAAGSEISIAYDFKDSALRRTILSSDGTARVQTLVSQVDAIKWRFLLPSGWADGLPRLQDDSSAPVAVAVDMTLSADRLGHNGILRRIVALPRPPHLK